MLKVEEQEEVKAYITGDYKEQQYDSDDVGNYYDVDGVEDQDSNNDNGDNNNMYGEEYYDDDRQR
jgi:hypothetical protein